MSLLDADHERRDQQIRVVRRNVDQEDTRKQAQRSDGAYFQTGGCLPIIRPRRSDFSVRLLEQAGGALVHHSPVCMARTPQYEVGRLSLPSGNAALLTIPVETAQTKLAIVWNSPPADDVPSLAALVADMQKDPLGSGPPRNGTHV